VLLDRAKELGAGYIATGHYAKLKNDPDTGRYYVSNSEDSQKDQTYALWRVSQEALSRTLFPLGEYRKTEIRDIAAGMGLKTAAEPDSQEICFVPNDDYRQLLEIRVPDLKQRLDKGETIYKDKKIGEHKGFPYYTIGQRRGLNISLGKPIYVSKIDSLNNRIYVDDEKGLYKKGFIAEEINLMKFGNIPVQCKAKVKIRYKDEGSSAVIEQTSSDIVKVIFDEPKKSITPGQSAVFYDGSDVIGGGIICEIIE
jgi:tRNA-specific 2-thiouridylase